jgi:hypothetical protein
MVQEQALKMDVRSAFKTALVFIRFARRRDFRQPIEEILHKARFIFVDDHGGIWL